MSDRSLSIPGYYNKPHLGTWLRGLRPFSTPPSTCIFFFFFSFSTGEGIFPYISFTRTSPVWMHDSPSDPDANGLQPAVLFYLTDPTLSGHDDVFPASAASPFPGTNSLTFLAADIPLLGNPPFFGQSRKAEEIAPPPPSARAFPSHSLPRLTPST